MNQNAIHVSIDLEAASVQTPDINIVSIGVTAFTEADFFMGNKAPYSSLYLVLNKNGQESRHIDQNTLTWWEEQNYAEIATLRAWEEGRQGTVSLKRAMKILQEYIGDLKATGMDVHVWGNGIAFDVSSLESACNQAGIEVEWPFSLVRDMRTLKHLTNMFGLGDKIKAIVPRNDRAHNALADSHHQGILVMESLVLLSNVAKSVKQLEA